KEFPKFDVTGGSRHDVMYFDGALWRHTDQLLQWNPVDDYLQLANAHSINWLDSFDGTKDFLDFAAVGDQGAAIGHIISKITTGITSTSGSYTNVTGASVAYASMDANTDYAVFVRAYVGNATSSVTNSNKVRLTKGGVEVPGSEQLSEYPTTTVDDVGTLYCWGGIVASGASGDLQLQQQSGNGADTVFANNVTIMMIKVDDLILNTNVFHDTDTARVDIHSGNWEETGAAVTVGDGLSDWLVFGSVLVEDFSIGTSTPEIRVSDGSATQRGTLTTKGDGTDVLTLGFMQLWQGVASSTTLSVQAKGSWANDKVYASVIAIRLNAFRDYQAAFVQESPTLDNGPHDILTLNFTALSTASYCFMSAGTGPHNGNQGSENFIRIDVDGAGDTTIAGSATQFGIANVTANAAQVHWGVSADQSLSGGEVIAADFHALDANTPTVWFENFLVAFQWVYVGDEVFDVGNAGYVTRMKGLTTRFYDPGLTDYVEFDHDDTDFNITGFQTTDINITGITALAAGTVNADFDALTATTLVTDGAGDSS
ncbi:hypothetical protein LCGC14_2383490, partial [marine sediment metagenome]